MIRTISRRMGRYVGLLVWLLPATAGATPADADGPVTLDKSHGGALMFRTTEPGRYLPAPLVGTDVDAQVAGPAAAVTVRQKFYNPTDRWLEAVYVFPLPEDAAVWRTRIEAGGHVIEGRIAERGEARRTYEKAAREGRRAGLVEQERPNLFTASVANIAPHDLVTVEISYQETLRFADGRYRFRFPMVVAPRYIPAPRALLASDRTGEDAPVPDADRISPPVLRPSEGKVNPVKLRVELAAGFPLASLDSPYFPIKVTDEADGKKLITLANGPVPADRDFALDWAPAIGAAPRASAFRETIDGDDYLLVLVVPPAADTGAIETPRDLTLVIDTSGSMFGPSLAQARRATALALDRLRPRDGFNLIAFDSDTRALFAAPVRATHASLTHGRAFLATLRADGGTEMAPALRAALGAPEAPGRLGQIILVTDGAVGNEAALLATIANRLGDRRLFTVAIGSAPNGYFLSRAARTGRGTEVRIGRVDQVAERMGALLRKIARPALTDIAARWPVASAEPIPARLPDLYAGDPLVLYARVPGGLHGRAALALSGRIGDAAWTQSLDLSRAAAATGIDRLWGRARIAALMTTLHEGADPAAVRAQVLAVALSHHLMSRYTSLVAVDTTPARPDGAALTMQHVPLNLPAGWNYEKVFGNILPKSAPPAAAPNHASLASAAIQPVSMPQTGTALELHLVLGLVAAAGALLILVVTWRRASA